MNKLLLLHKACPLNHSLLDIKTKKIKITFNVKYGKNYAYSYCNIEDYFNLINNDIKINDYRITSSYFSFEINEKYSSKIDLNLSSFGTDNNCILFDCDVNTNMCHPDYICVYKSTGTRALDKILKNKKNRLLFCFKDCAPKDGIIVLNATLHYFILKN